MFDFSGQRPDNLGVRDGKLLSCPNSPNCVCSYDDDAEHAIASLPLNGIPEIRAIVESMERTTVVEARDDYLYAEFKSQLMGFVDDVEFYRDETAGVVQVRSASRLGQSDLGVNRKRVEAIRSRLQR
ncbi:hypothetical protein KR51_00005900 [Rubidibacter lacunae KORDI 51-2]|uniref:DUF1499 domain-containing protein n=1 Tax=Rubidibacter lacunae KORDI 51-2 TaxID=582515 RepID=U5DPG2_9CHRO|nr:DUF1499 domain-containing protein [Rubidibacter lacunae]ERN42742.1 hypothetical protein KR51_00005900 [Rubidibacter lacunae KORDI 51-2]